MNKNLNIHIYFFLMYRMYIFIFTYIIFVIKSNKKIFLDKFYYDFDVNIFAEKIVNFFYLLKALIIMILKCTLVFEVCNLLLNILFL